MNLDELNLLVSESIRRAELLEDLGSPTSKAAWAEVSLIEEQLALRQTATTAAGAFARRGAVSAALKAGDLDRAESLLAYFNSEKEVTLELLAQFRIQLEKQLSVFETKFPYATRKYGVQELRRMERLISARGGVSLMVAA